MTQDQFDKLVGRLDRILSELTLASKDDLDAANRQTLKHHAEDVVACGKAVLRRLGYGHDEPAPGAGKKSTPYPGLLDPTW
jgi:hypothetical protein